MRFLKTTRITVTLVSCIAIALPGSLSAAAPHQVTQDVAANELGAFTGTVKTSKGISVGDVKVVVHQGAQAVAETKTESDGTFTVRGLRGGVYRVATQDTFTNVRLWASRTAPPSAADGLLLVTDSSVVRGQGCSSCDEGCTVVPSGCEESCTQSGGCGCGSSCCDGGYGCGLVGNCGVGGGGCGVAGCGMVGGGLAGSGLLPLAVIGGAAAAIAIPLALDDDDVSTQTNSVPAS